jgi:hypothetical protein
MKMEQRLWITARSLAQEAGMDFTVPCAAIVRDFIRAGTRNMVRENRVGEQDFDAADANLGRFIGSVVEAARGMSPPQADRTGPAGPIPIREAAVVSAKVQCPLWPFC